MHLCVCNLVNLVMHHVWWEYSKFYSILFYYVATVLLFLFTSLHVAYFPHSCRAETASKVFLCRQHQHCLFTCVFIFFTYCRNSQPNASRRRPGAHRLREAALASSGRWASPLIGLLKFSDTVGLWTTQTPSNIKTKAHLGAVGLVLWTCYGLMHECMRTRPALYHRHIHSRH